MNFLDLVDKDIERFEEKFKNEFSESLQRTLIWYAARLGKFTGSRMKELMATSTETAKIGWDNPIKLIDFSETAIGYIYEIAQQRRTGIADMDIYAKSFEHGKEFEPLLVAQLINDNIIESFEEVGFVEFPKLSYAGASADGKIIVNDIAMAYEGKATTTWKGHYARFGKSFSWKHKDFWQTQSEMIALNVNHCLFAAAYPGVYDKYDTTIVELSHVHKWALLERLKIANMAAEFFIEGDATINIFDCVDIACKKYEF